MRIQGIGIRGIYRGIQENIEENIGEYKRIHKNSDKKECREAQEV